MGKTTLPKGVSRKGKKSEERAAAGRKGGLSRSPAKVAAVKENGKEGGRPSLYRPEYVQQLVDYFNIDETRILHKTIEDKKGNIITVEQEVGAIFPTLEGFACRVLNVAYETALGWTERHPEWKEAWDLAKTHQARILMSNALLGHYMQPMSVLFAKTNMGYVDRIAMQGGGDGTPPVQQEVALRDETEKRHAALLKRMKAMKAAA